MESERYVQEIIQEKNEFHNFLLLNRKKLEETIKNKLEINDENLLKDMIKDIDEGDEIVIETYDISKFRIATKEDMNLIS